MDQPSVGISDLGGGNANLEVMVSGVDAVCTAYLTATQL